MRGVTAAVLEYSLKGNISTHTPHARRDALALAPAHLQRISTHTPHARRDAVWKNCFGAVRSFQLTRLMRGVTITFRYSNYEIDISTHTPHARRDIFRMARNVRHSEFQLTRLMRGVTETLLEFTRGW